MYDPDQIQCGTFVSQLQSSVTSGLKLVFLLQTFKMFQTEGSNLELLVPLTACSLALIP